MKRLLYNVGVFLGGAVLSFILLTLLNYGANGKFVPFRYMMF